MSEEKERSAVVREAGSWRGTPYHLNAQIKGVGVDCGTFLTACFENTKLIPRCDLGHFKPDFAKHRGFEVYRHWLQKYCDRVDRLPLPGDIILYKYGRIDSHGAIVVLWPRIIHAYAGIGVIESDGEDEVLRSRQTGIYSFWR